MKVNVIKGFRPNATDSKSVELWFMSVRVGLGVPIFILTKPFRLLNHQKIKFVKSSNNYNNHFK